MDGSGGVGFIAVNSVTKKRRTSRRPRSDMQFLVEGRDTPYSSMPSSDHGNKLFPNQNLGYNFSRHSKEFDSKGFALRIVTGNNNEGMCSRKIPKEDRKHDELSGLYGNSSLGYGNGSDSKRCSDGLPVLANWNSSSTTRDGLAHMGSDDRSSGFLSGGNNGSADRKLKKVRLKVRINPKSNSEDHDNDSNTKPSQPSDATRRGPKSNSQGNLDDYRTNGASDFHSKLVEGSSEKLTALSDPVRKSNRVPKRRVLDGVLNEGDDGNDFRYFGKLKPSKFVTTCNSQFESVREVSLKKKNLSKVSNSKRSRYDVDEDYGFSRSAKESRKKLNVYYVEEDGRGSDDRVDPSERKKQESVDKLTDARMEALTTRQRALQSTGESLIEFPDGLPPVPPRKLKEKLSEEEKLAKKAEIAQRRKLQAEKAAKESEAEAIRKILGQDSNRKKKEEKMRKERDDRAQKKAVESMALASNSIRWVMGPTGTIVTFGEGIGLPSIFGTKTSRYPPPREKCAAPLCTNSYKYRDSKLNLPLCSLQCYKAVRESSETISSC